MCTYEEARAYRKPKQRAKPRRLTCWSRRAQSLLTGDLEAGEAEAQGKLVVLMP